MAVKYVKDFDFPAAGGFHVQRYAKGGHVKKMPEKAMAAAEGMPSRAKPNAPARGAARMESKPKMGKGQGYAEGGRVPGREMDKLPAKKPPGRMMDLAPSKPERGQYQGYAKGGKVAKLAGGGPPPGQFGRYQTPESIQMMQTFGKKFGMSPQMFERMVNETIEAADKAPAMIKAAGKAGLAKGLVGGGIGGALGTAYGPDIMNFIQSLAGRTKPTVTATDMEGKPLPKARGGKVAKYAKGGKVQKYADGGYTRSGARAPTPQELAYAGRTRIPGAFPIPEELAALQQFAKAQNLSPTQYNRIVNQALQGTGPAVQVAAKSGMTKGLGVGTPLGVLGGALGTAYGPDIMNFLQSLMGRAKPTVTVEEIPQTPQGRARGGSIKKSYGRKR